MATKQEQKNFLLNTADLSTIAPGIEVGVNLEAIKTEFGLNFNTFLVQNAATEEISVKLNGRKIAFVKGSGGSLTLDWEDGLIFDDVRITNEDGATTTSANEIRISIGRTGVKNG